MIMDRQKVHPLTNRDVEEGERILLRLTGQEQTLSEIISSWRVLVHKLHWGYLPEVAEFRRLVAERELLHRLSQQAGESLRVWLEMILQDLDTRFLTVTMCRNGNVGNGAPCWECRVPSAADEDWRQQLESIWETIPPECRIVES